MRDGHLVLYIQEQLWCNYGLIFNINPVQDGLFWGCSRMGVTKKDTPCLKSVTHILQWWNLVQLYLTRKRSKKCMNHLTHPMSPASHESWIGLRRCLCDNWKPSFLSLLIFNWRTFLRRATSRWWHQWAKNQVLPIRMWQMRGVRL